MIKGAPITTLFVDIGGVLPTHGWDHHARRRAAKHFKLNWAQIEERRGFGSLNTINLLFNLRLPWALSFSFARAINNRNKLCFNVPDATAPRAGANALPRWKGPQRDNQETCLG